MVISCSSRNCCGTRSSIADLHGQPQTMRRSIRIQITRFTLISLPGVQPRRMHARGNLIGIDLLPLALVVADEIAAARRAIDACIFGAGWRDTLVAQGARR